MTPTEIMKELVKLENEIQDIYAAARRYADIDVAPLRKKQELLRLELTAYGHRP